MAMQRRFEFMADRPLVEMAQRGSLEAYDELVNRFRPAVVLTARQVLDLPETAQDVAQEAFLLAFRSLAQLQDPDRFAGWLYTITRHRARQVAARQHQGLRLQQPMEEAGMERMEVESDPAASSHSSPLAVVLQKEREQAVHALLATLAPDCRIVLHLFYFEQWPASRIADFLSLPLTTIKWRLRYGRQQLCIRAQTHSLHSVLNDLNDLNDLDDTNNQNDQNSLNDPNDLVKNRIAKQTRKPHKNSSENKKNKKENCNGRARSEEERSEERTEE